MKKIIIPGDPVTMPRPRSRVNRRGVYMPSEFTKAKNRIRQQIADQWGAEPFKCSVSLDVQFYFRRPKAKATKKWNKKPFHRTERPDIDNCYKTILDAAEGVLYLDDKQVSKARIEKMHVEAGAEPYTEITIMPLRYDRYGWRVE